MSARERDDRAAEARLEERAPGRGWARRTLYGEGGPAGTAWRGVARPLGRAWEAIAARRLAAPRAAERLGAPTVAVGNVTVGGGGKTSLVDWLLAEGLPPGVTAAVLSRGYGRVGNGVWVLEPGPVSSALARVAGDEPALLARRGAWVGVAGDRALAARAVEARVRPDVFLLDDALQNRAVARAFDLVAFTVEDLAAPARCLPAGPLRQGPGWRPPAGAWIVVGGDPRTCTWPAGTIGSAFGRWWRELPGTEAAWEVGGTVALGAWSAGGEEPFETRGRPIVAFAGVARPDSVRRAAEAAGLAVATVAAFPDHWNYRRRDVEHLLADHPAADFLTTEKDAVKLDPAWWGDRPVGVLRRRLAPRDPALLRELVQDAIGRTPS
jgi:tetraacyldisaccharide 4'-kinase